MLAKILPFAAAYGPGDSKWTLCGEDAGVTSRQHEWDPYSEHTAISTQWYFWQCLAMLHWRELTVVRAFEWMATIAVHWIILYSALLPKMLVLVSILKYHSLFLSLFKVSGRLWLKYRNKRILHVNKILGVRSADCQVQGPCHVVMQSMKTG